uniref:Uncharacterized protein n=1 Tax=Arundo donax TaxID=35708 RepID=A0A0A9GFH7_ARUDO
MHERTPLLPPSINTSSQNLQPKLQQQCVARAFFSLL